MTQVTAVIPTRGRPALLTRAIQSVLEQERVRPGVIVVVDGPADPDSVAAAEAFGTDRVRVIQLPDNAGPAICRTTGALAAETPWVAFLDDDDLWYPSKLMRQLGLAEAIGGDQLILSCRSEVVTPTGLYVWPRRLPRPGERVGDYLFCRRSLFKGDSFVQASSILCPRSLLEDHPQRPVAHEDWDWLLDCCERGTARLIIASEPLVRHYTEFKRSSLSNSHEARASIRWVMAQRRIISRAAYAGLILQVLNGALVETGDRRQAMRLLGSAFRHGRPRFMDLSFFLLQWLIPTRWRRRLRSLVTAQGRDSQPPDLDTVSRSAP